MKDVVLTLYLLVRMEVVQLAVTFFPGLGYYEVPLASSILAFKEVAVVSLAKNSCSVHCNWYCKF